MALLDKPQLTYEVSLNLLTVAARAAGVRQALSQQPGLPEIAMAAIVRLTRLVYPNKFLYFLNRYIAIYRFISFA